MKEGQELTKRDWFAAMALQGLISDKSTLSWYKGLNEIKEWVNKNNSSAITYKFTECGISTSWNTFLYKKGILYNDENGYYRWKNDIEVTVDLIDDFRKYSKLINKEKSKKITNNIIKKRSIIKTNNKYYSCLEDLKKELDTKNVKNLATFLREKKVNQFFATFLKKNGIIYINSNGFYKWNIRIPVSINLINAYRLQYKLYYDKHNENRKVITNKQQLETQPELQFDMNYIEIPAEIKDKARAESKTRTTKVKVQQPINISTQQNEYGLIRKFLKWIY